MKRKARIQTGIDDRLVAIYARKSRITNKGDSIGVQFKQSADYAINQLSHIYMFNEQLITFLHDIAS